MVPKVVRNSPEHPSAKKSMVPLVVSNGLNIYPNIDTIHRPVTFDIDSLFDCTDRILRSIVH